MADRTWALEGSSSLPRSLTLGRFHLLPNLLSPLCTEYSLPPWAVQKRMGHTWSPGSHKGPLDGAVPFFLLPWEVQMLTKRGSDLAVTAGPGRGKDTHSPVEATEELRAVRGETERVSGRQLILRAGKHCKQAQQSLHCPHGGKVGPS